MGCGCVVVRVSGPDVCLDMGRYSERRSPPLFQVKVTEIPVNAVTVYNLSELYILKIVRPMYRCHKVECQSVSATGSAHTRSSAAGVDNSAARVYRVHKPHGVIVVSPLEYIDVFVL
jgi:hypothetical protein